MCTPQTAPHPVRSHRSHLCTNILAPPACIKQLTEKPGSKSLVNIFDKHNLIPLAVIEAKDNTHTIASGIQQAIEYAKLLDVPFAYSSNGDGFIEHDLSKSIERFVLEAL